MRGFTLQLAAVALLLISCAKTEPSRRDDQTRSEAKRIQTAGIVYPNKVGAIWAGWNQAHFSNYASYIPKLRNLGFKRVTLTPTYFLDTYAAGIIIHDTNLTPSRDLQKTVLKELINQGFAINFRPHLDPFKFSLGSESAKAAYQGRDPGSKDWRGKFDKLDPTHPTINYENGVILPALDTLANAIREAAVKPTEPIRFDLGAELMDSIVFYSDHWIVLSSHVRAALDSRYSDVKQYIILSHNFSHHIEYQKDIPDNEEHLSRIDPNGALQFESRYVDRMTAAMKRNLGLYIAGLDTFTLSQYMPLDIVTGNPATTTPDDVKTALQTYEKNLIDLILIKQLGMKRENIPNFHIGEYGMGIRGLTAPNVWDSAAWRAAGQGNKLLDPATQQLQAKIAIQGLILYMEDPKTVAKTLSIWLGGAPYDIFKLNDYTNDNGNPEAAAILSNYLKNGESDLTKSQLLRSDRATNSSIN